MKWCKYFIALSVFASARLVAASSDDTLSLVGGLSSSWTLGWYGESFKDTTWCGYVFLKDPSPDTTVYNDTSRDNVNMQAKDTVSSITSNESKFDSLTVTTTSITTTIVKRHTLPDTLVDLITIYTQIIDSSIINNCDLSNGFKSDSGGIYPDSLQIQYIDFSYKFRNYYAQLPIVWSNWSGMDASGYKYLKITYKGLLPTHQAKMEFFYAAWGSFKDTTKSSTRGDGVGTILPSPDAWSTVIIPIPDSVDMFGITGLLFAIQNQPNQGGQTSALGNIKIANISLLKNAANPIKSKVTSKMKVNNRFFFTPSSGSVVFNAYSLKGEALASKTISVRAGKQYSIGQFVAQNCTLAASQVRLVTIKGEGVNITTRMW